MLHVQLLYGRLDTTEDAKVLREKKCETIEEAQAFIEKYNQFTRYREVALLFRPTAP